MTGAHDRNRTGDLLLTMQMLYRLSYVGATVLIFASDLRSNPGAGNGIRTRDPQLGRLML